MDEMHDYREQNKRLCELIDQNNKYYQHEIDNLRSQAQRQELEHKHEVALLQGQLTAFRHQAEELQKCRKAIEDEKQRLLRSRIICAVLCAALAVSGYTLFNRLSVPAASTVSVSPSLVTANPTNLPTKKTGALGFSAGASNISSYSATYVWIPHSGDRYHDTKTCSNMQNPSMVTLQEAKRLNYTPCGRCRPSR